MASTVGELVTAFERQADECREFGSPFCSDLLAAGAHAVRRGGAIGDLLAGWPGNPRTDALPTRLLGGLHAAVLTGRHDALARCYPSAGGPGDAENAWRQAERFAGTDGDWLGQWLQSPPQTNETARSAGLLAGLLTIAGGAQHPVTLLELGASAGLNLNLDAFRFELGAWSWGPASSVTIRSQWTGPAPSHLGALRIARRAGCDQSPLDVRDPADRLRLQAYVWAGQSERAARLDAAMALAQGSDVELAHCDAADWVEAQLSRPDDGHLTVVYHSIFYHYPPAATRGRIRAAIELAGARATQRSPLAWLRYEFEAAIGGPRESRRCVLEAITWPGGQRRLLAVVDPHGRSVDWLG